MRFFLSLVIGFVLTTPVLSGQILTADAPGERTQVTSEEAKNIVTGLVEKAIADKIAAAAKEPTPKGMDEELALCLADINTLPDDSREYARYFTLYTMQHDPELVKKAYLAMTFWIHSLSNQNIIRLPQLVENSNGTLFRVDIRDYGWQLQSFENVSFAEPYVREPWINHESYNALRLIAGNVLIRGDWFIDATSTPVKQIDNDQKTILYYELIYGDKIPKNKQDFYNFWRADINKIEGKDAKGKYVAPSLVQQILVKRGKSGVANNNRVLARAPTELGYLWETSDFKNSNGPRNVIENLQPGVMVHSEADAGEFIASDLIGLQKYFVTDKAGNRVDIADPAIAWDRTNPHDIRVMTGRSCVECHAGGINQANNVLQNEILVSNKLKTADYDFKLQVDSAYLATMIDKKTRKPTSKIAHLILQDSELYDQAVFNVNGLSSTDNAAYFREVLNWYNKDIDLQQAARECGVTIQEFQDKVGRGTNGELNALRDGGTVTRAQWEDVKYGLFAQAMILIKSIDKTLVQQYGNISTESPLTNPIDSVSYIQTTASTDLKLGTRILGSVPINTRLKILEQRQDWYKVSFNSQVGWVYKKYVRELTQ